MSLYLLSSVEHLLWDELGREAKGRIEEGMRALEAPGSRLVELRDATDMPDGHTDSVYSAVEEYLSVPFVAT